jgi:hypothetical protein
MAKACMVRERGDLQHGMQFRCQEAGLYLPAMVEFPYFAPPSWASRLKQERKILYSLWMNILYLYIREIMVLLGKNGSKPNFLKLSYLSTRCRFPFVHSG